MQVLMIEITLFLKNYLSYLLKGTNLLPLDTTVLFVNLPNYNRRNKYCDV
jgi:hypothetical protein